MLPGPRRSEKKRRRIRYFVAAILVLIVALGWIGYRELLSATGSAWFSGP